MVNNQDAKFIAHNRVMELMQEDTLYTQIEDQLISVNPSNDSYTTLEIDGITVWVYPIKHYTYTSSPHVAYVVHINGVNIYFGGDNIMEGWEFAHFNIQRRIIHLAFVRFWDFFQEGHIDTLNQFIDPDVLVPMHFLYGDSTFENIAQVEDSINKFQDRIPETHIFRNYLESKTFNFMQVSSIDKLNKIPYNFGLYQNYPNPFNPATTIQYVVGANNYSPLHINLSIYNLLGEKVATLVNKRQPAGSYKVEWDGRNVSSGIYFYKLETETGFKTTRKLILLK